MTKIDPTLIDEINQHQWYQTIPLSDDYSTPGETKDAGLNKLHMMDLPEDLAGGSVLDIGCNEGFFAFEAERRNAGRVVAVDKSRPAEEKFKLIKRVLGSNVEFISTNLFDIEPARIGSFDIVFFLSVFHHLRYPFLALDRLRKLTKDFAVVEYVEAVADVHDPSALVRKMSRKGHLHMLPTRTFMLELLEQAGFAKLEVLGEHRGHKLGEERRMPGFSERRTLIKAFC